MSDRPERVRAIEYLVGVERAPSPREISTCHWNERSTLDISSCSACQTLVAYPRRSLLAGLL